MYKLENTPLKGSGLDKNVVIAYGYRIYVDIITGENCRQLMLLT